MRPSRVVTSVLASVLVPALLGGCSTSGVATSAPGGTAHAGVRRGDVEPAAVAAPAASQEHPARPTSVTLPSGRVMPVDPVRTLPGGALAIPRDIHRAGWWAGSSRLGDPFGSIVLAAHVDSFTQGVGPAAELLSTRPGAHVRLAARHRLQGYRVTAVRVVPRARLRRDAVAFSAAGGRRLVLITCGGPYDASRGGYLDNVVVVARPTARP